MSTQFPLIGRRGFFAGMAASAAYLARHNEALATSTGTGFRGCGHGRDPRELAYALRVEAAKSNLVSTPRYLAHPNNGDEELYRDKIATFTKGLQHNDDGEVILASYASMMRALETRTPAAFEAIVLGGVQKLVNPQAGAALELMGGDAHSFVLAPPPVFASREAAAEICESYWMALLRDVPFSRYPDNPVAEAACRDLNSFGADAKVPKAAGHVTPELLFRGLTQGALRGPYVSQFFYQPTSMGAHAIRMDVRTYARGVDYLTRFPDYLAAQRGVAAPVPLMGEMSYLHNGRDVGRWVHTDVIHQAYFQAALVMKEMGIPLNPGNPYRDSRTQLPFGTLGEPAIAGLLGEVAQRALRAVWFQKWFVHRRARPESFAARVHRVLHSGAAYPVHPDILESVGSHARLGGHLRGTALLPQAYPEGAPNHPAYGAGHATVAGACVTLLKAWYDCSYIFSNPLQPTDDGTSLVSYSGSEPLTIAGELDKVACNVALARNIAGVHWRSDATASLKLGEAIAVHYLREVRPCLNEEVEFVFDDFDGRRVVV